jgi:hypothetical protein
MKASNVIEEFLSSTNGEPRSTPLSIPMTRSEYRRFRDAASRLKIATNRHVLPQIARKCLLDVLADVERWLDENEGTKSA